MPMVLIVHGGPSAASEPRYLSGALTNGRCIGRRQSAVDAWMSNPMRYSADTER